MRYRILGPLEFRQSGEWHTVDATKWRTLLAVLLCHPGRPVSADRLIEELWAGRPPASALKLLQVYVSRLRRLLGEDALVTHKDGYRAGAYELVAAETDVACFDELAERGRGELRAGDPAAAATTLAEALDLWRGPAFADVPPTPAVLAAAEPLEERRLSALEARADALLRDGRPIEALSVLEPAADDQLRETLHAHRITALYRCGRQADALDAYEQLRRILAEELGVDPSPPLQRLHQAILTGDLVLSAPTVRPRQLPRESAVFTGRDGEIARVRETLGHAGPVVISAVDGIGGVGKSALAIQAAHREMDRFPDGQLYADLHGATVGLAPLAPREVLARFLRALGLLEGIPADTDAASAEFRSLTADRRLLVVLDNAATADQVRPLLPAGTGCAVLVTSRKSLTTLDGAVRLNLDVLPRDEAVALIARLAGPDRVTAEPAAAADIAELCGRLPLALRIAGARLAARPSMPLTELAARFADEQTRLENLQEGDLAVRASFQVGYQAIDPLAGRAFRLLGLLDGPDTTVPVVAAGLDIPVPAANAALERLVDARLVQPLPSGRYTLHDLLRLFAREQAHAEETEDDVEAALTRMARHYLATSQRAVKLFAPLRQWPMYETGCQTMEPLADGTEALAWLEAERANLVAFILRAERHPDPVAWLSVWLAHTLSWFFDLRGHSSDHEKVAGATLRTAGRFSDRHAMAWSLDRMAFALGTVWRSEDAVPYLERAIDLWQELDDRDGEQRCLCNLGWVLIEVEKYEAAVDPLERQIQMAGELGNDVALAIGLSNLAAAYRGLGRTGEALTVIHQGLDLAREIGDTRSIGISLYVLGLIHHDRGDHLQARTLLEDSLRLHSVAGSRHEQCEFGIALSRICRGLGDYEAALRCIDEALAISRLIGRWEVETTTERERVLLEISRTSPRT